MQKHLVFGLLITLISSASNANVLRDLPEGYNSPCNFFMSEDNLVTSSHEHFYSETVMLIPCDPPKVHPMGTRGYVIGFGATHAGAMADARKSIPNGAQQSGSPKFVKEGNKWKCTLKWYKK